MKNIKCTKKSISAQKTECIILINENSNVIYCIQNLKLT